MKNVYYAVSGQYGLGIFTDYNLAYNEKDEICKFRCKKCKSIKEARLAAIERYNSLQEQFDFDALIEYELEYDLELPLNKIVEVDEIRALN